jgi:hypothetical protein
VSCSAKALSCWAKLGRRDVRLGFAKAKIGGCKNAENNFRKD